MALVGELRFVVDLVYQALKVEAGMAKKNIKPIQKRKDELRANLLELAEACPFHLVNPEDCPLFPLRKMEPRKRLQWLNALSKCDLAYLTTYHRVCLSVRVKSKLAQLRTKARAKKGRR